MLTLLRPVLSNAADQIEEQLTTMNAAYQVITKEVSTEPYLIESGEVIKGTSIATFLADYLPGLHQVNPSDSREIG